VKSWEAIRWVKNLIVCPNGEPITRSEKLLLFVLADYHNEAVGDYASPGVETLAAKALYSKSQTLRLLDRLAKKAVIRIEKHHSQVNRYFLEVGEFRRPAMSVVPNAVREPVDNSVRAVDGRCHFDTSNDTSEVSFRPTGGVTAMEPPRCHSYATRESSSEEEEMMRGSKQQQQFGSGREGRWDSDDLWLKRFLDSPDCFFIPIGALDDPVWWGSVSRACGGISLEFLKPAMAKMRAWVSEGRGTRPETDAEWKDFVRRWLCRENEWAQRVAEVRRAS
jgi:DNA-binding MarR family transcriptional regulator